MRPFRKFLTYALGMAGGVAALYGVRAVRDNLKGDPLAQFRAPRRSEYPDTLGLRLTNVRVRRYVGSKIETQFQVRQVDVEKNRNIFAMTGIHDGVYRPVEEKDRDQAFRFAAGRGRYNGFASVLNLQGRVTIRSKEYDLASNRLDYDGLKKVITIANSVQGTAWGGKVRAEKVTYNIDQKAFTSGASMWRGKIPARYLASMGMPASYQLKQWEVESGPSKSTQNGRIITYQNATLKDADLIITAPKVVVDRQADTVVATGGVQYWSGRANFVADKVTILRKEKRAILENESGYVRMLVKPKSEEAAGPKRDPVPPYKALPPESVAAGKALPKPTDLDRVRDGKSVRDYPLIIVGTKVDYNYAKGSRLAIITGNPQARQELGGGAWRQVWTNTARYDAENELLRLNSTKGKKDARLKNSIGDDMTANWFELSTAEGEDEFSGDEIKGTVTTSDDDEVPKSGGSPPPPGPGPGTKPPPPRRR